MSCQEFTEEYLALASRQTPLSSYSADEIAAAVARKHGMTVSQMKGPNRMRTFILARADLYRELRDRGWSYPAIGAYMGRDHTTIMNAIHPRAQRRSKRSGEEARETCRYCRRPEDEHVRKQVSAGVRGPPRCPRGPARLFEPGGPRYLPGPGIAKALEETRANIEREKEEAHVDRRGDEEEGARLRGLPGALGGADPAPEMPGLPGGGAVDPSGGREAGGVRGR